MALALLVASPLFSYAGTTLGAWTPIFKGVDHAVGTNTAGGGGFPDLQVVYALRVDLADPQIQLYASPPISNYSLGYNETAGYTTTNFLKNHSVQAAVNANGFFLPGSGDLPSYTLPEGSALNVAGLLVSQGQLVSAQDSSEYPAVFMFATNKTPVFLPTNWPARPTSGMYTAVAGSYSILVNGLNIGSNYLGNPDPLHALEPRTAMGVSQDLRYLYLLVIDGRQPGYSVGAYDWETAAWLLLLGAWNGINLDGGGSSCLVMMDSKGDPLQLNHDSASVAVGRERTVGCHFGLFAAPLPGFFNDVLVLPDDTAATITWTTLEPVTTQVKYGLTTNLPLASPLNPALTTNHAVLLTNLTAGTRHYFTLDGGDGSTQHVSSMRSFTTTNYLTAVSLFDFVNPWKYTIANLDRVPWTTRIYDDSGWEGPGPGLLWVDSRGANANIPVPMNTEMPDNPATGYPYRTYYFRTHFTFTNDVSGVTLRFQDYLDDGAVFYLNGSEIRRIRMAPPPTVITNNSLASGYACSGDATCPDYFSISGPLVTTNLVAGDNVLAVEAHNYNPGSLDITFGLSLAAAIPYVLSPRLDLSYAEGMVTLSWDRGGFVLQEADAPAGPWMDVPGPVFASPYSVPSSSAARFFRMRR